MRVSILQLYQTLLRWSQHPKGPYYLGWVSFLDASVFPISPLFMFLPISYAQPKKAFYFAAIVIVSSFVGGVVGYGIGFVAFESVIAPVIDWIGYTQSYQKGISGLSEWGEWAIVLGSLTPFIPYKIFTIGAGAIQLNVGKFLVASFIGRSLRFLILAGIIRWGGPRGASFLTQRLFRLPEKE